MFRTSIVVFALATTGLSACGGGGSATGTSTGGGTPPLASQPALFPNALSLTTAETAGLYQWRRNTPGLFNTLNTAPDMTSIPAVIADYEGQMVAQIGSREEYLSGYVVMRLDFNAANGFGFVNDLDISGNDATYTGLNGPDRNRQLTTFDQLDITLNSVTPTSVSGTITGSVDDSLLYVPANLDTYTVDATLDGRLVQDPTNGNVLTALAGVVDGTITSTGGGTQSLNGIVAAQEQAGTGVGLP